MRDRLTQIVGMDWGMSGDEELDLLSPNSTRIIQSFSDEAIQIQQPQASEN
jgi:hypothetical protein